MSSGQSKGIFPKCREKAYSLACRSGFADYLLQTELRILQAEISGWN